MNSTSLDGEYYAYENIQSINDVVTCIIIAIGLPLTLVVMYSLYFLVRNDHVAPIYVINLLISDLIQLCCLIVQVVPLPNQWIISSIYIYGVGVSVCFMVCVALERYLVIAHPLWYRFRRTIKISVVVCVVVWALPLIIMISAVFFKTFTIFAVCLLLPFPLFIFILGGTLKALSASISVPSDEKRRIVGILVLVLLIYTLLFLPTIIRFLATGGVDRNLSHLSFLFVRLSPLADLTLYVFMKKETIHKLLASVCCCRIDSNEISSPTVTTCTQSAS